MAAAIWVPVVLLGFLSAVSAASPLLRPRAASVRRATTLRGTEPPALPPATANGATIVRAYWIWSNCSRSQSTRPGGFPLLCCFVALLLRGLHATALASHLLTFTVPIGNGNFVQDVECALRRVAFDAALRTPTAKLHANAIATALEITSCPADFADIDSAALAALQGSAAAELRAVGRVGNTTEGGGSMVYLDCGAGDDGSAGSKAAPLRTVAAAQKASRAAGPGSTVSTNG